MPDADGGYRYFNSRTHVECDQNGVVITTEMEVFQLTHSRGVRLYCTGMVQYAIQISTHALTWSATLNIVLKKDSPHSIWEVIAFYHQLS